MARQADGPRVIWLPTQALLSSAAADPCGAASAPAAASASAGRPPWLKVLPLSWLPIGGAAAAATSSVAAGSCCLISGMGTPHRRRTDITEVTTVATSEVYAQWNASIRPTRCMRARHIVGSDQGFAHVGKRYESEQRTLKSLTLP